MKKTYLLAILGTLFLFGCKPLVQVEYIDRWHETTKVDSIYKFVKDTMTIVQKGDTVFISHWSTKIDYKYKYLNKTDTVVKTLTQTKIEYVEKPVVKRDFVWWFGFSVIMSCFIGFLVWIVIKLK